MCMGPGAGWLRLLRLRCLGLESVVQWSCCCCQGELKDALARIKPLTTVKATATAVLGKNSRIGVSAPGLGLLAFLSFKGSTQAHFVKTSITTNKFLTLRLKEDNDLISAISAAQVLSINP